MEMSHPIKPLDFMEKLQSKQAVCRLLDKECASQAQNIETEAKNSEIEAKLPHSEVKNPDEEQTKKRAPNIARKVLTVLFSIALLALAGYGGTTAIKHAAMHEETDDAYVTGHLHQVSTRVNGTVEKVLVDDNEHVKKGQVLVLLDPRDYKAKADQASASLDEAIKHAKTSQTSVDFQDTNAKGQETNAKGSIDFAKATITRSEAQIREAQANIEAAQSTLAAKEAELERASADYTRYDHLEKEGAISTSQRDAAKRDYFVALGERDSAKEVITQNKERLMQAQQTLNASKAELTKAEGEAQLAAASAVQTRVAEHQYQSDLSTITKAKASLQEAELNLSYTKIVAPTSGRIGKKTVEDGQRIEPGQPLLTIVADDPWVVANYKETQLQKMKVGQSVEIKIDSIPEHKFEGKVQSFSPASGSSFAILPSDNATGNFTKIVQRLPVKILFTSESMRGYEDRLAPGLSVITSVEVEKEDRPAKANEKLAELRK